jgi:hypothetical protein
LRILVKVTAKSRKNIQVRRFLMMPNELTTERREADRFPIMMRASVMAGGVNLEATIFDVSACGAKVRLDGTDIPAPENMAQNVVLHIPAYGEFPADVVWRDEEYLGLRFHADHSVALTPLLA